MHSAFQVVAVTGCTATGKTSLCQHLQSAFPTQIFTEIVHADKFFQQGPLIDPPLSCLAWPTGKCPQVFAERKYDTNHPSNVCEAKLLNALQTTIARAKQICTYKYLLVEGYFLLAHASLLPYFDRVLILDAGKKEGSSDVFCRRKYERDYTSRCTFEDFQLYWSSHVYPSFLKYGLPTTYVSVPGTAIDPLLSQGHMLQQAAALLGLSLESSLYYSSLTSSSVCSSSVSTSVSLSASASLEAKEEETIICISDIHGHISKLRDLWRRLEETLESKLLSATVIFLGDYCDRGPHTKEVLDFLVTLQTQRKPGMTVFLAGNHDFAFGAFLGCPPLNCPDGFDLESTTNPHGMEMFWKPNIHGGMHFQGRRWAGPADIYETGPSFKSYGVKNDYTINSRNELLAKVPQSHKDFLQSLVWLHDQPLSFAPYRLICVHAGLVATLSLDRQMASLKMRCVEDASLQSIWGRFDALSGRKEVLDMHPELGENALLVSGHHGVRKFTRNRYVLDLSGGKHFGALEAVIFTASGHQVVSSKATS